MNNKSEHKQTDAVKISHNIASMLDVSPTYPVVQVDENYDKKKEKITKEIIITALILVSVVMIEAFILLQIEHAIGKERLMRYIMIGVGILTFLMMMLQIFIVGINKTKKKKADFGDRYE